MTVLLPPTFHHHAGCKTVDMPRHDWNTPAAHSQKPRHAKMHSPAHGAGHDKKLRAAKRVRGDRRERCPVCGHPAVDMSRHKRANHRDET